MNAMFKKILSTPWFALVVTALAAFIVYSNVYDCPFVFDDNHTIVKNTEIGDLSNFSSPGQFLKPRAVVDFTFALNYRFGKLDVFGYHLINILIHIVNGFVVYFLALAILRLLSRAEGRGRRTEDGGQRTRERSSKVKGQSSKLKARGTKKKGKKDAGAAASKKAPIPDPRFQIPCQQSTIPLVSLFAAIIFVVHPIQTQAVTYIVQRYTSAASLFYMMSVLFYVQARAKAQNHTTSGFSRLPSALYLLSFFCGLLAFMSKQNTASLPGAILLAEFVCFDGSWRERGQRLLWLMPAFILYTIFILHIMGLFSGHGIENMLEDVSNLARETKLVGRWIYLCTQFNVLVIYIRLLFLPIGQNLDYLYPFKTGFFDGYTPLAFLFLVALAGLAVWKMKKRPVLSFCILWFFITLSVESSIVPIKDALFEHRLYLPMFGFAVIAVRLPFRLLPEKRTIAAVLCISIIISLGSATYLRNGVWRNPMTLWTDVVTKAPHNNTAHNNIGTILASEGRLEDAIKRFSRAVQINPGSLIGFNNLGLALIKQGKLEEAVRLLLDVRKNRPDSAETCVVLGVAMQAQSRITEAIQYFSEAVKIKPDHAVAHYNLGNLLGRQGKTEEKIRHLSRAVQIDPSFEKAYRVLGVTLLQKGKFAEAIGHLSAAAELMPDSEGKAILLNNIGTALARQEKYAEAVEYISRALKIKPGYATARNNLDAVLEQIKK